MSKFKVWLTGRIRGEVIVEADGAGEAMEAAVYEFSEIHDNPSMYVEVDEYQRLPSEE